MFGLWKRYDGVPVATRLSFIGTLVAIVGALLLIITIEKVTGYWYYEWLLWLIALVTFIGLKLVFNQLTDYVADKLTPATSTVTWDVKTIGRSKINPEDILRLSFPASLTITRDAEPISGRTPTLIFLNGEHVASLRENETVTIPLELNWNILQTNTIGSKNARYEVKVDDGARGTIHVSRGLFLVNDVVWKSRHEQD
ncbi:MAG: hypothetical protein GX483_00710 [Actinomycetaceae bacterium]|nr:hypothetical protein [Actinomycetaceae bacterium]